MGRVMGFMLVALLTAVIIEQTTLFLAGRSITSDQALVSKFVADVEHGEGSVTNACRRYGTVLFYSFRMCAGEIPGRGYYDIRVEYPAGYLTLIPRDHPDRILFDGRSIALVSSDGIILEDRTNDRQ